MQSKELKKLSKNELRELLIAQTKQTQLLQEKLDSAKKQLQERAIAVKESGSLAEAALKLNGVFAAADKAAADYLNSIELLEKHQRIICSRLIAESRQKSEQLLAQTESICLKRRQDADKYFTDVISLIKKLLVKYPELAKTIKNIPK